MSEDIIKKLKVSIKGENKILLLIKNVEKSQNLKNLREKNNKITPEFQFCDGEDLIDFELESDYEIGDLVDAEGKIYIKSSQKLNENDNSKIGINNIMEESQKISNDDNVQKDINDSLKVKNKFNMNLDLIEFINKLSNSNEDLRQKLKNIFEENYMMSMKDLLNLKQEDFEIFKLPPLIKKKLIEEINILKPKEELSENEKKLIKTIFDQELPPEIIYDSLGVSSNFEKQEKIKKYYFSLKKPTKPFPQNTKQLIVKTSEKKTLPCYKYPEKQYSSKRYYTLLVMGETGSGKNTLLDAFVNYLADMNYDDPWRYKLVDENNIKDVPPGESQTHLITSYYVNYQREDGKEINIRIVDTPGLGDTKGVQQDNEIIKQFNEFFATTLELDYILVTVKSTTTRWTQANQYIYDRVQEIFGKDAKDRFILMCTFSDGQKPLAIGALEGKLHYEQYFCFNNSALYTPPELTTSQTKFFWKLGMDNVKKFFDIILEKNYPPLSLKLTKQVMSKRGWLFENVKNSQKRVNDGFRMLDQSRELLEKIKKNKALIDQNGEFKTKQIVKIPRTVKLNNTYQFCSICKQMCCQVCTWPQNEPYSMCSYFDPNSCHYNKGGCPRCPGHCDRYSHVRANEYIVYDEKEEEIIITAKKQAFEEGKKGLSYSDMLLNDTIEKMRKESEVIIKQMKEIKQSLEELDRIALKPRVLTNVEYFQQMIDFENQNKKPGYKKRVEGLEMMKGQAEQLNTMSKAEDITQLFPNFNNVITELKTKSKSNCMIF